MRPRADEFFFLLGIRDFDDGVDENTRRDDGFGIDAARLHELVTWTIVQSAAAAITDEKLRAAMR